MSYPKYRYMVYAENDFYQEDGMFVAADISAGECLGEIITNVPVSRGDELHFKTTIHLKWLHAEAVSIQHNLQVRTMLSDDEFANAFYLYDHRGGLSSMHWLQSAKDRIRWLSRKLVKAQEEITELKELLAMKNTMDSAKDDDRLAQLRVQAADFSEFVAIPGNREIHVLENGRVYLVTNTNKPYEAGEYPTGGFVIERARDVNRKTVRIRDDAVWSYIDHSPCMEQVNHFLRASARAERVKGDISGL